MNVAISEAIEILKNGGIVLVPTDTAYGISCRIDSHEAVGRLFHLRNRPQTMAVPILCSSVDMVKEYVKYVPQPVQTQLMEKYWPGALTIILSAMNEKIPSLIRGGTDTIGVRIPNHPAALELIEGVGVPLVGTSANFHGNPTPYAVEDLDPELVALVDGVVEGVCTLQKESTVVNCTKEPWEVVRQGAVVLDNGK